MRPATILTTFCLFVCSASGQDAKADLEKLQGDWAVTAMQMNGKDSTKEMTDNLRITFKGETMILARVKGRAKGKEYTIKLDPSKKPNAIDLSATDGKAKGFVVRGIYQIDGMDVKLCISNTTDNERPTEFKSAKGSELIVLSLTPASK